MSKAAARLLLGCCCLVVSVLLAIGSIKSVCDTREHLKPLLTKATRALHQFDLDYFLDFGTLLGVIRDHDIIPHEYDVDLTLTDGGCARLPLLRSKFAEHGLRLYTWDEWIPQKYNRFLGSDGYVHVPCARFYDKDLWFGLHSASIDPFSYSISSQLISTGLDDSRRNNPR